jgi:hypothetical protein
MLNKINEYIANNEVLIYKSIKEDLKSKRS